MNLNKKHLKCVPQYQHIFLSPNILYNTSLANKLKNGWLTEYPASAGMWTSCANTSTCCFSNPSGWCLPSIMNAKSILCANSQPWRCWGTTEHLLCLIPYIMEDCSQKQLHVAHFNSHYDLLWFISAINNAGGKAKSPVVIAQYCTKWCIMFYNEEGSPPHSQFQYCVSEHAVVVFISLAKSLSDSICLSLPPSLLSVTLELSWGKPPV